MALLIRKRQLAAKVEASKGVFETDLQTAANAKAYAESNLSDPSWSPTVLSFDRNIRHPFLTPVGSFFPDIASAEMTFTLEMGGHTTNDGTADFIEPPIGRYLAACGFKSGAVSGLVVTLPYTTGTIFKHGEVITGAPSGGSGTVIGTYLDAASGTQTIYVEQGGTPLAAADVITGVAATEAVDSVEAFDDWAFYPQSTDADISSLSIAYYVDGKRLDLKGCRGNVVFQFTHADRLMANFTFTGIIDDYADLAGGPLTGANAPIITQGLPPAVLGTGLVLEDPGANLWTPVYNEMTIDMQNNVILREDSSDPDGWNFATISTRDPQVTLNPDEVLDATHTIYDNVKSGALYSTNLTVGATSGNIWDFNLPGIQWNDPSESDREEVTTWDLNGRLTGGTDTTTNTPGGDNEVVIINR